MVERRRRVDQRRAGSGRAGDRPGGFILDAPWAYLVLGIAAGVALGYRVWELWNVGFMPLPLDSPGIATAAIGVALVLYGAGIGFSARRP